MKPLFIVCALGICGTLFAATETFQPSADTTISQGNAVINPDGLPSGSTGTMVAGQIASGATARALLRFDLSSIPVNATVTSVSLNVIVTKQITPNSHIHALHRLNVSWTESGATWVHSGVSAWTGGDFNSPSDATVIMAAEGSYTFLSTTGLVNTVQRWVTNSALNHGWLLRNTDETTSGNARRFGTREESQSPALSVDYTLPVPAVPAVTLLNPRVETGNFRFEFTALAMTSYTAEYKESLNAIGWTFLANYADLAEETTVLISDPITPTNRFYRVVSP